MDDLTRRGVFHRAAEAGLLAALTPEVAGAADSGKEAERKLDRDCVLAAGMTEDEADCWALAADLAGKFFELPELHPMDKQEIATAVHVIQHKLLSRPTYRKYKEAHKKSPEKK